MSAEALSSCWGPEFPPPPSGVGAAPYRLVALAVADIVNDMHHNRFYGSLGRLADKTGVARDTVRRVMAALVESGVIEVERECEGAPTVYRWLWFRPRGETATPPRGGTATPLAAAPRPPRGGTATNSIELNDELNTSAHPADARARFDEFWSMYPRRIGKTSTTRRASGADIAWEKATRLADPDGILAGLARRVDWWKRAGTPMDKIPYPATWLNQCRWEDEIEPVPAQAAASAAQASANAALAQRDEAERAIADGNPELAWKIIVDRAASSERSRWWKRVADALTDDDDAVVARRASTLTQPITVEQVAEVRATFNAVMSSRLPELGA